MRLERLGFEFRVELAAKEPRMFGRFDYLDVILIRRASRDFQSRRDQCLFEIAIKFVAMTVALADFEFSIRLVCEGTRLQPAWPGAQAHGAAHFVDPQQLAQFVNHAMRSLRIKFGAV